MTVGGLACEAVGNATPGATTGTFAVALVGETDAGWLAGASSAEEAIDIVHRILPRAREVWRSELLVRPEDDDRNRDLLGAPFPGKRAAPLTAPRMCYGCAGTGKRGVFDCGVCAGSGKLTGPPVQAHADSFRRGALRLSGSARAGAAKRTPVIRTRRRRRRTEPGDSNE